MSNTYFNNQTMGMGNNVPFGTPMGFPQNNGLSFGTVAPAKSTSSTPDELNIIKSQAGSKFDFSDKDAAVAGWDFREGTNLCIEIIDPKTERVRVKYTGEEFNIVLKDNQVLIEILEMVRNFVDTAKLLNTNLDPNVSKQMNIAFGMLLKLLPEAYEAGKKNYGTICQQMQNMLQAQGYQGTWGGQQVYNGSIGASPNYYVNDSSSPMNVMPGMMNAGMGVMTPQMQSMINQAYAAGQQNAGMGMMPGAPVQPQAQYQPTPMVTGGTMMGGNPFVQGGQPQSVNTGTPPIQNIPMPGAPVQPQTQYQPAPQVATTPTTPNPSIGGAAQNGTTTTSSPF